jgi:hypothetical protein
MTMGEKAIFGKKVEEVHKNCAFPLSFFAVLH